MAGKANTQTNAPKALKKERQTVVVAKRILKNPTATVGFIIFILLIRTWLPREGKPFNQSHTVSGRASF